LSEGSPDSPFGHYALGKRHLLSEVLEVLDQAARDPRIKALVVRAGDSGMGMAQTQEILNAVTKFRLSGRPAYLFAASMNGTVDCYLASAFGEVWLQPSGEMGLTGFAMENPFLKGTLDSLGVEAVFSARREYKSAPEMFTNTEMTGPSRESLAALLASWSSQVVADIARSRKLSPERVRALIDQAPLQARQALAAGLVDHLGYYDELTSVIEAKFHGAKPVELSAYDAAIPDPPHSLPQVAVIHGLGTVLPGESRFSPLTANASMGAETILQAFEAAIKDDAIVAIIFRVDSPGGDYTASDAIWHEVKGAREKGKPVVASMGDLAASGGYFASMAANRIIAAPGTITGSIGVFSGKFVLRDFWNKFGVRWGEVHVGANAPMWSSNSDFTPEQRVRFEAMLDAIYADFTTKAAADRNLTPEQIDHAARGRVFTGADALQVGLVDALGDFGTAVEHAKKLAKIPAVDRVNLVSFPKPKGLGEALADVS
ncbi:MAG: signal peptide peptidase SppA, partial [Alphaproteobacteria bacterium]|nr:signal peptide peptidase SppA [Alphaproteobacteria bacterium]